jgi:hypothetical protein
MVGRMKIGLWSGGGLMVAREVGRARNGELARGTRVGVCLESERRKIWDV